MLKRLTIAFVMLALAPQREVQARAPTLDFHNRPGVLVPLEDRSGHALAAFAAALARLKNEKNQVHVAFYGASHTAADLWTGDLRRIWQVRWGESGHGFFLPARWNPGYRQQDLVVESSKGWIVDRHKGVDGATAVGDFGYAGLTMTSNDPQDFAEFHTTRDNDLGRKWSHLELWLRKQPQGGDLKVEIDGKTETLVTRQATAAVHFADFFLDDAPHSVRISPVGNGPVTLYGAVVERKFAGIQLDNLGIPGMRADIQLHWLMDTWQQMIQRRKPDLVVFAYGTNDVGDEDEPIASYLQTWRHLLVRYKTAVPDASCLMIGPTDRLVKGSDHHKHTAPRTPAVIAAQKQIAAEFGCGYWDAWAAMGGDGSMQRWTKAHLTAHDGVHLNAAGYQWLAEMLDWAVRDALEPVRNVAAKKGSPARAAARPKKR